MIDNASTQPTLTAQDVMEYTAEIVSAYVSNHEVSQDEISDVSKSHLTEENLDEYLEKVETDEHSKELLEKYLAKKSILFSSLSAIV